MPTPTVGRQYSVICPLCYANVSFECRDPSVYGLVCTTCSSTIDLRNPNKTLPSSDSGRIAEGAPPVQYSAEVEESGGLSAAAQVSVLINDVEKEKQKTIPTTMTGETKQAFSAQRNQALAEKFYFFFPLTYAIEYILFGRNPTARIGHVRLFRKRIPFLGTTIFCVPKTSTSYAAPVTFVVVSFICFNLLCRKLGEPWLRKWVWVEWILVFFFFFFLCRLAYTDPGYIRPGYMDNTEVPDGGEKTLKEIEKNQRESRWENVNGVPMERKWCSTCEMYRPPRAAHCYLCGLCCYDHDHHCTVIGVCVGRRKVEMFTMFVTTAASACVVPSFIIIYSLYAYNARFSTAQRVGVCVLLFPLFFFSIMLSMTALSMWQSLALASSTRERIQNVYMNKKNPYDNGVVRNLIYHLFKRKVEPSIFTDQFVKDCALRFEKKDLGTGITVTCA